MGHRAIGAEREVTRLWRALTVALGRPTDPVGVAETAAVVQRVLMREGFELVPLGADLAEDAEQEARAVLGVLQRHAAMCQEHARRAIAANGSSSLYLEGIAAGAREAVALARLQLGIPAAEGEAETEADRGCALCGESVSGFANAVYGAYTAPAGGGEATRPIYHRECDLLQRIEHRVTELERMGQRYWTAGLASGLRAVFAAWRMYLEPDPHSGIDWRDPRVLPLTRAIETVLEVLD